MISDQASFCAAAVQRELQEQGAEDRIIEAQLRPQLASLSRGQEVTSLCWGQEVTPGSQSEVKLHHSHVLAILLYPGPVLPLPEVKLHLGDEPSEGLLLHLAHDQLNDGPREQDSLSHEVNSSIIGMDTEFIHAFELL